MPLYERSLAIKEKTLGPEHAGVATMLNNMGASLYRQVIPSFTMNTYRECVNCGVRRRAGHGSWDTHPRGGWFSQEIDTVWKCSNVNDHKTIEAKWPPIRHTRFCSSKTPKHIRCQHSFASVLTPSISSHDGNLAKASDTEIIRKWFELVGYAKRLLTEVFPPYVS